MMKIFIVSCILLFVVDTAVCTAQEKAPVKFGDVTEKDFLPKVYSIDSNANAVVIADIGSSKIEGNNKGWFSLIFKHYRRVHILNKNGYDIANMAILLYADGRDEEQIDKIKAVTYNLENGKVVQTKLDTKNAIYKDVIDKKRVIRKFTFPNVKEGSIIEFEYTIVSDFLFNLQPWAYQGSYPRLWSEYNVALPEVFAYASITQGNQRYYISDKNTRKDLFIISDPKSQVRADAFNIEANVTDFRWVMKNVVPLKEEGYSYTVDNHVSKISFQLAEQYEPLQPQKFIMTWEAVAKLLRESKDFGMSLTEDNYWLGDIVDPLIKGEISVTEKAQKIFNYVRDNFVCNNYNRRDLEQSLRNVLKNKNGNVAEINILLTAMLKYAGIDADPVILSTRSNGYTYTQYPIMSRFNYVVVRANLLGKLTYLDASEPRIGFGHLPLRCYNGHARVINTQGEAVELKGDQITEASTTTVFMSTNDKGKLGGTLQQNPGYYESFRLRNVIKEKGQAELQTDITKKFTPAIDISNFKIDSLNDYEKDLGIKYSFELKDSGEDILYLNPYFGETVNNNPFKSTDRLYPVEMPYLLDATYNLQIEVPKGYIVDELPKSILLKLNAKGEGAFEYTMSQAGETISLRSRMRLFRAYFNPEEYRMLREFFNQVVKKQSEQIVFKKKK